MNYPVRGGPEQPQEGLQLQDVKDHGEQVLLAEAKHQDGSGEPFGEN